MGALPWGYGKSQSTMAKLTPMRRQGLPWACRTCHLLMFLGPHPLGAWGPPGSSFVRGLRHGGLGIPEPLPELALHK